MSKITAILGYSNFELIRSKIAYILADELSNQLSLNNAELLVEQAKASPDQNLIDLYCLNIECIPSKVYEERFYRVQPEEMPLINIVLVSVPLNEGTNFTQQIGVNKYQIEIYQQAKSTDDKDGDVLATLKLHRLLAIVRQILMNRNYVDLDLPGQVGFRQTQDLIIGQPNIGADNANSTIFGKIDLMVKSNEEINDLEGIAFAGSYTNMRIYDSELGYYWEIAA